MEPVYEHDPPTFCVWKPCGCVEVLVVMSPEMASVYARTARRAAKEGRRTGILQTQSVREMPWKCGAHKSVPKGEV